MSLTRVVLYELLKCLKLGPGGDVIASAVQLANLIVFDMVSLDVIPVLDREGVGSWNRHSKNNKNGKLTDSRTEHVFGFFYNGSVQK